MALTDKAQRVQNKLNRAYGKVAKKLGARYDVYRITTLEDPIQASNWIWATEASFTKNDNYSAPGGEGIVKWIAYLDGRYDNIYELQSGDFFYDPDTTKTYFVSEVENNKPHTAYEVPNRITISRAGAVTDGTFGTTQLVTNFPCQILQAGASAAGTWFIPASTYAGSGVPSYRIRLWAPQGTLAKDDLVVDQDGNESKILSFHWEDEGYTVYTQSPDSL